MLLNVLLLPKLWRRLKEKRLPLSLAPAWVVGAAGGISKDSDPWVQVRLERETGLGPATLGLGSRCSAN